MKKNFRLTFMTKVMMIAVIPCLIVSIFMCGGTLTSLKNNMTLEIEEALRTAAYTLAYDDTQKTLDGYKETLGIDVTVFHGDERVVTTVPNSVHTHADPTIYATVKSGEEYFSTNANVNGQEYFGYYIPTYDENGNFVGMTFAGKPTENANAVIANAIKLMFLSTLAVIGVVIVLIFLIAKYMTKMMQNSTDLISEVSQGNFAVKADKKVSADELGDLYRQVGELAKGLCISIKGILETASRLGIVSETISEFMNAVSENTIGISKAAEEMATGALAQADNVQKASNSMDSVNEMIVAVQYQIAELETVSVMMQNIEKDVVAYIDTLKSLNVVTNEELKRVEEKVAKTSKDIKNIQKATEIIKDIADETNLLSLNASIEASKAGEAGRGFAVVAEQVKSLSQQSSSASDDIENILETLTESYQEVISSVSTLVANMDKQSESIAETHSKISVLDDNIENVAKSIEVINESCTTAKELSKTVVDAFTELSSISQENAAGCEETNASVEELNSVIEMVNAEANSLNDISKELVAQVDKFRV